MACTLAESPSDPFHRKLRQLRCLHCRFNCYRVERTSSRAGVAPAEVQRLSRRTFSPATQKQPAALITNSFEKIKRVRNLSLTLSYSGLFYGSGTVSDDSRFVHCAVGDPAMFAVPVIMESESQKRSTALPVIVEGGVLLVDRSMLELLIATRPP